MIDNRMISSKAIIAKVIADLELKEPDIRITDIKEYILEAILKIGAIQQYDHKVVILPIINHQAALPCDLYNWVKQLFHSRMMVVGYLCVRLLQALGYFMIEDAVNLVC